MKKNFTKYHGTGNDFILIDNRKLDFPADQKTISLMCNRRLGVGADGLILLNPSDDLDFSMRYFNSDGNEGSMCGNGGRCITAFAAKLGIISREAEFSGIDGTHSSMILPGTAPILNIKLSLMPVQGIKEMDGDLILDTGSPHYVNFKDSILDLDVFDEGRKIRKSEAFPEGINVNFAEILSTGSIKLATYERGVEAETLSCGTGVTAAAIAAHHSGRINEQNITVITRGGELQVSFTAESGHYEDIWLQGPATEVFTGEYEF
ncbi:MAG: diaminopimelate epimerase [Bacteroidales bacterium]|nr:diaminopimelate epimerase [Bacteroidales bacterium]MCF8399176.1 diaminopimelate epimerase [Bacteroidales bacterium]